MTRSSTLKALGVGAVVLGALAFVTRKPATAAVMPTRRVALIGDSYAVGLGPELAKTLPEFQFEGHVGTNTAEWATHSSQCGRCGDWLTAYKPDVVLVALGVNDGTAPNPSNYQTIVRALHGIGARVVWIEPPAAVKAPAVRDAISSLGVTTVSATATPLAADGLHPRTYSAWAQEIARTLA